MIDDGLIEAKLMALLALEVDRHLRETNQVRSRQRSVDLLLSDAGLSTREIAKLLGKTERAVNLKLASERRRTSPRKVPSSKRSGRRSSRGAVRKN